MGCKPGSWQAGKALRNYVVGLLQEPTYLRVKRRSSLQGWPPGDEFIRQEIQQGRRATCVGGGNKYPCDTHRDLSI